MIAENWGLESPELIETLAGSGGPNDGGSILADLNSPDPLKGYVPFQGSRHCILRDSVSNLLL